MRDRAADRKGRVPGDAEKTVERVGDLQIAQPAGGYRYGLDPFLLVSFIRPRLRERIADIGTGCGIILLLLARKWPTVEMTGVELQSDLARLAEENVRHNGLEDRCRIIEHDIRKPRTLLPPGSFDRVVSNPPFRPPAAGKVCPDRRRALARHEIALTFTDLCRTVSALLKSGGRFDFIHLPERIPESFSTLSGSGLEPKEMRFVQSFSDSPPELVLISARCDGRPGLKCHRPLIIYERDGTYREDVARLLYGPHES